MRRSINGPRSASTAASLAIKQNMGRRDVSTDENNTNMKSEPVDFMEDANPPSSVRNGSGPLSDRVKRLEKKFAQVLEIQAKFGIMDKWLQQQFGIKLFPKAVVNSETFAEGNPDDVDNPFYAVYLVIQRMKTLEDKVARLEARPYEDLPEPPSNYSSTHAFRNIRGRGGNAGGGVKRTYGAAASPSTPKKQKVMPRPVAHSSNYPFKPSVKILPRDPNAPSPLKKQPDTPSKDKNASPIKTSDQSPAKQPDIKIEVEPMKTQDKVEKVPETETTQITELQKSDSEEKNADTDQKDSTSQPSEGEDAKNNENLNMKEVVTDKESKNIAVATTEESEVDAKENNSEGKEISDDMKPDVTESFTNVTSNTETENPEIIAEVKVDDPNETITVKDETEAMNDDEDFPILEDSTAVLDEEMEVDSEDEEEEEEVELKPEIPLEEETAAGDVSGSEASVSSLTSASGRSRLSTRRQAAAAAAAISASVKGTEEEKPVMYTARGRRHTVPRRYAEFTGHDNVVSILKSQQRAEKIEGRGPGRPGRKPGTSKAQDSLPKIKKMVKGAKTPTQKKAQSQIIDSDGDCEPGSSTSKKKSGSNVPSGDRPPCVDALVDRVMAREVDSDGMVLLSEAYPNIYVNQQQLVTVVVRSNGKATRLTRKMTTLVFEDSLLASASPFGTKYYKDRLPPEPLEAMVDFIAASGFEPHYTKKKIYMIVGQVCNEARAGRVSRKFMQPLEATPTAGPSGSQSHEEDPTSTPPASPSIPESSPQ